MAGLVANWVLTPLPNGPVHHSIIFFVPGKKKKKKRGLLS